MLNERGAAYATVRGPNGEYAQFAGWETEPFGGWCEDVGAPQWLSDVVSNVLAGMKV